MKEVFSKYGFLLRNRVWVLAMILSLLALNPFAIAQTTEPKQQSISAPDDRSPVRVRHPNPEKILEYQNDRDYQYDHEAPPPTNPVGRLLQWLYSKLVKFLSGKSYQTVWQYVLLAVIAGVAIYLLKKAEVLSGFFGKKAETSVLDYENLTENIHEINFEQALEEAIYQRNFRLGVRLLYLQTLKRLADAGQIEYKLEKTNRHYVSELNKQPFQADFEKLTRLFEFVWYGDFPIDENQFAEIKENFRAFGLTAHPNITPFTL